MFIYCLCICICLNFKKLMQCRYISPYEIEELTLLTKIIKDITFEFIVLKP
jgi:hypothetical protein